VETVLPAEAAPVEAVVSGVEEVVAMTTAKRVIVIATTAMLTTTIIEAAAAVKMGEVVVALKAAAKAEVGARAPSVDPVPAAVALDELLPQHP
jgi:hypothetical protein